MLCPTKSSRQDCAKAPCTWNKNKRIGCSDFAVLEVVGLHSVLPDVVYVSGDRAEISASNPGPPTFENHRIIQSPAPQLDVFHNHIPLFRDTRLPQCPSHQRIRHDLRPLEYGRTQDPAGGQRRYNSQIPHRQMKRHSKRSSG